MTTYVTPDQVASVMHAVAGVSRADRMQAENLPDAVYNAALRFAHRARLIHRTGQLVKITHAGRRYLRRYVKASR